MATDLERLVVQLSADFKSFEKGLARAQGVSNRQFSAIEARARKLNSNLSSIGQQAANSLIAPLSSIGAALGVREIARYADTWTEAGNKIRAAATSAGVSARSLDQLKEGANNARTDLSSYVDLYARLIRSASGVVKSEQDIADMTNIVAKAFKAGGASASEQAAGILQLGQALGSGVLQGDELRSLRENAPILAQAIATEFKTTIAGLKQLGADGELVSDRVAKAILGAQKPIEAQFKATNATIGDAITNINNEFLAYIGNADASAGASQKLVEALQFLSDNFGTVADAVVQFATVLIAALTGRALLGVVAGLGNAVVALGAFLTALRAGTLVAAGFTAALGPIGLLAGAAAAAIYLLSDSQAEAKGAAGSFQVSIKDNESALRNATDATYAQVDALRQLIAAQAQAARAEATQAEADYMVANARRVAFRGATGGYEFAPFKYDTEVSKAKADELGAAAGLLEKQLAEADKLLVKKPSGFGNGSGTLPDKDGKSKKTRQNEYERDVERVIQNTAALVAETEAQRQLNPLINDYGYAAEKARLERELLTAAEEAGKEVTPQLRAEISALADQYALAGVESAKLAESQDELKQSFEDMRDLGKDVMGGFINDLIQGKSASEALAGALGKVGDKLLELAMNDLFGKSGSGGLGLLGSLFGFGGGGQSAFTFAPGMGLWSDGGYTGDGGKDTPAGTVHKGEYVFSKAAVQKAGVANLDAMHRNLKGFASGGAVSMPVLPRIQSPANQNSAPQFTFAPTIDARGASVEAVARLEQVVARQQREFSANVVSTVRKMRPANVKV